MSEKLIFVWVGETRRPELRDLEEDYVSRIDKFFRTRRIIVPPVRERGRSDGEVKRLETDRISESLPRGATLVVLDERGRGMTSLEFAKFVENTLESNPHGIAFVTGGDLGLSGEIRSEASRVLALSKMTLPHEVARVVLLEQVYRSCTLVRGIRYHK